MVLLATSLESISYHETLFFVSPHPFGSLRTMAHGAAARRASGLSLSSRLMLFCCRSFKADRFAMQMFGPVILSSKGAGAAVLRIARQGSRSEVDADRELPL